MASARGIVRLEEHVVASNSTTMPHQMLIYFDRETKRETKLVKDLSKLMMELLDSVKERQSFIEELEVMRGNLVAYKSMEFLKKLRKDELVKVLEMRRIVAEL
ncbi:hypothetical protein Tco_0218164 [Tanacetum coccineum]